MNQITAFLSQAASPIAAGAQAHAGNTASAGEGFAAILAQLQGFIGNADAANAPARLQNALGAAAVNLNTPASQSDGTPTPADAKALLDVLAALGVQPSQSAATPSDATNTDPQSALAAQLVALQLALQNANAQPEAKTEAAASATAGAPAIPTATDIGLRGTIAPAGNETKDAAQAQTPDAATAAAAAAEAKPAGLAPPIQAKPLAAPKRAANAPSQTTTAQTAPEQQPQAKNAKAPEIEGAASSKPHDKGANAQTHGDKPANAQAPATPTPVASATPAPTTPAQANTPQFEVQVATAQQAVPVDALAVHIARKFNEGSSQFEISLHPAELGKVDISLAVAHDGRIQAVLRAERPETLDMLQKDARVLEQQLRQAGLDVGSNALSFSLSNGNNNGRQAPFQGWPAFADAEGAKDTTGAVKDAAVAYLAVRASGGVDIRI